MDEAAKSVMEMFTDITLAFGESDEFRRVDFSLRNEAPAAEERLCDQLLVQKIDQCLQQATRKDTDDRCIPVYVFVCVQLGKTFPRSELEVPSVV